MNNVYLVAIFNLFHSASASAVTGARRSVKEETIDLGRRNEKADCTVSVKVTDKIYWQQKPINHKYNLFHTNNRYSFCTDCTSKPTRIFLKLNIIVYMNLSMIILIN